jgi:hypothetical protein
MQGTNSLIGETRSPRPPSLGSEFNAFLFAPVYEEKNETPLSVISALARLNLDPWEEAAALARLAPEPAARRLASLLAKLPHGVRRDPGTISASLVALLPQRPKSVTESRGTILHPEPLNGSQITSAICMICLAAFLTTLLFMTSHGQPTRTDSARSSEVSGMPVQTPVPHSGQ